MRTFCLSFLLLVILAPLEMQAQREKLPPEDLEIVEKRWPQAKRTSTSLRTLVLQEGSGDSPRPGDMITVNYSGKLLNDQVFDENWDRERPFTFRLGRGHVIEGWEEGIQMMKRGERRLLIVPFELGYGTRGNPPRVPRRSTLIFEVELIDFKRPDPPAAAETPPSK